MHATYDFNSRNIDVAQLRKNLVVYGIMFTLQQLKIITVKTFLNVQDLEIDRFEKITVNVFGTS